jgi:hypothetical protein
MRKARHVYGDRVKLAKRSARTWRRILAAGKRPTAATLYTRRTSACIS